MSQRAEKYARNMERRVGELEETVEKVKKSLMNHAPRLNSVERVVEGHTEKLWDIEDTMKIQRAKHDCEVEVRRQEEVNTGREIRRNRREIERDLERQRRGMVLALLLAIVALIVAVKATGTEREAEDLDTEKPTAAVTASVGADLLATEPVEVIGPWEFAALYRAAEDPAEKQRIGEALEAQGYFSAAVPMPWEYQDYMRTYCHLYGCPYPLALAVADWETRGQFNMDAIGPAGEVGIFQLNPGPDGSYHAELEAATGLDPTTPEGNIAGGCYKLGKYLAEYGDVAMVAMAYNRGQAGARAAWEAGITSNEYTDAVLEAMERWECAVNAWAGE